MGTRLIALGCLALGLFGCVPSSGGDGGSGGSPPAGDGTVEGDDGPPAGDATPSGDAGPDACAPDCADRSCGDGQCTGAETCASCLADCGCPADRICTEAGLCEPEACQGEGCGAPPRILTFNANVRTLTEGGEVILSAVVTDPDGIGDLIGGVLEDPGGASYGAFATAGEEGAYGLTLSWAALHAVRPIEFDGEATRSLVAAFFDQAGNRTTQVLELTLHCRDAGGSACDGACVSLDSAAHCGACRAVCDDVCEDRTCVCPEGLTRCGGACVDTAVDPTHCGICDMACPGAEGGAPTCVDGRCADPCPGAIEACGGVCVDVRVEVEHCGDCGQVCRAPENGTPACRASRCEVDCDPGSRLCDAACVPCPEGGVEGTACADDACVATRCAEGFELCGGACDRCPADAVLTVGCADDRCVATACAPRHHPCAEGCCPWRTEVIGEAGTRFDMVVRADGVHVVVGDRAGARYGRQVDGDWRWEPVHALDERAQNSVDVALAFGPDGPYVALTAVYPPPPGGRAASELVLLQRGPDGWAEVDRVRGGQSTVDNPALVADGDTLWIAFEDGVPHVGDTAEDLALAEPVGESAGWSPHLAVDRDGEVHLAYWIVFPSGLGYARRAPGGAFEEVDIEAPRGGGLSPRVAIDADGHPAVLHRTDDEAFDMSRFDGNGWRTRAPFPGMRAQIGHDLIRHPEGDLMGCFGSQLGVFVFREDGLEWQLDEVANGAGVFCKLGVGADRALHLIYHGDDGLTYAR